MLKITQLVILGLSLGLTASVSLVAHAGDANSAGGSSTSGNPIGARPIAWEEFKERCAHPEQFDVQRAPQNIRIQCGDVQREYVAAGTGDVALPAARHVATAVFADKFFVNAEQKDLAQPIKGGSCMRFKEVERSLTIEKPLTCEDVANIKGDLSDYCASSLDLAKGVNPKLVSVKDTGGMIDTCQK